MSDAFVREMRGGEPLLTPVEPLPFKAGDIVIARSGFELEHHLWLLADHEILATIVEEKACPPGFYCTHEVQCPGTSP